MTYTLIITAWREPVTVIKTLTSVLSSNKKILGNLNIFLVCPDDETKKAGELTSSKYNFKNFKIINDPGKGKPLALNIAFKEAKGDILFLTDGDVVLDKNSLEILAYSFSQKTGAISGRPVSADSRKNIFGYWGHLLADAAHFVRKNQQDRQKPFFLSGYLYAIRNFSWLSLNEDELVDDAFISLEVLEKGFEIQYQPKAQVFIKYPRNFSDWVKQKRRSIGGYSKLNQKNHFKIKRNFFEELKFIFFPISYAKNAKELFYSVLLYPARLFLWVIIFYDRLFKSKKLWVRIESSK